MSIPAREAARKGLFGLHSPMVRWLQDMVICELDSRMASGTTEGQGLNEPLLLALYKFCSEATDMVRAFLLASLCRDAVSIATKKKEAKTYGKVSSADSGKWMTTYCPFMSIFSSLQLTRMPLSVSQTVERSVAKAARLSTCFASIKWNELGSISHHSQ